jgi:hypothetical protein
MKIFFRDCAIFLFLVGAVLLGTVPGAHARTVKGPVMPEIIGKTVDGKYNVYNVKAEAPDDFQFFGKVNGQAYKWTDSDFQSYLPPIQKVDLNNKNYICGPAVCFTRDGHVIGSRPYK